MSNVKWPYIANLLIDNINNLPITFTAKEASKIIGETISGSSLNSLANRDILIVAGEREKKKVYTFCERPDILLNEILHDENLKITTFGDRGKREKFCFSDGKSVYGVTYNQEEYQEMSNHWYNNVKPGNITRKSFGCRAQNDEVIGECIICHKLGLARVNATSAKGFESSSFDAIDPKTGKTCQFKMAMGNRFTKDSIGPSSFGPKSIFDILYFQFLNTSTDTITIFKYNGNYKEVVVNKGTGEKVKDYQKKGKRPRFNFLDESCVKPEELEEIMSFKIGE